MKLIILLLIAFSACLVLSKKNYDKDWMEYKKKFEKSYGTKEDARRKQMFIANIKIIEKHNEKAKAGIFLFYMGEGPFTDVSDEELEKMPRCAFPETKSSKGKRTDFPHLCENTVPDSIDWNARGFVTPAQYQGGCGSCYAFATSAALEAQVKKSTGQLIKLSQQVVVDCGSQTGNKGCNGGFLSKGFKFFQVNNGSLKAEEYPYISGKTKKAGECKSFKPDVPAHIKRVYFTGRGTEEELRRAVGTVGPVTVATPVTKKMSNYKDGMFMDPECASKKFGHAVLVTGYGKEDDGTEYWIIKNSWGTNWGQKGFMRMKRNAGICRIGQSMSYPVM